MSDTVSEMYLLTEERQQGPLTPEQVNELHRTGNLPPETEIWQAETGRWTPATQILGKSHTTNSPIRAEVTSETSERKVTSSVSSNETLHVIVTDIHMKFSSMIWFMVKWTLASIPAFIILVIITVILLSLIVMVFGALGLGVGSLFF